MKTKTALNAKGWFIKWTCRDLFGTVSRQDGFGYTLQQAQMVADAIRRDFSLHGTIPHKEA